MLQKAVILQVKARPRLWANGTAVCSPRERRFDAIAEALSGVASAWRAKGAFPGSPPHAWAGTDAGLPHLLGQLTHPCSPSLPTDQTKIRTIPGPAHRLMARGAPFPLANRAQILYHQQTKNLLVSYSPKKLGFF